MTKRSAISGRFESVDIAGKKFGNLTAIEATGRSDKFGYYIWLCRCACGATIEAPTQRLFRGSKKSCGCLKVGAKRKYGDPSLNCAFLSRRAYANKHLIKWTLTREEAFKMFLSKCTYCGSEPSNKTDWKQLKESKNYSGIDRKNSQLGYVKSNCVPCCWVCNRAKGTLSVNQFMSWIKQIIRFHSEKAA